MTKYVIDLPEGTKSVVAKKRGLLDEIDVMRIPVDQLEVYSEPTIAENAIVEKRVIELPADAFAEFEALKQSRTLLGLLGTVYDRGLQMAIPLVSDAAKQKIIGEYYSNHVKFVSKEEALFYVMTDFGTLDTLGKHGETPTSFETLDFLKHHGHYYEFTEEEADELVAGLTALNARKVKVDE